VGNFIIPHSEFRIPNFPFALHFAAGFGIIKDEGLSTEGQFQRLAGPRLFKKAVANPYTASSFQTGEKP
jgi:hypothetical protein